MCDGLYVVVTMKEYVAPGICLEVGFVPRVNFRSVVTEGLRFVP